MNISTLLLSIFTIVQFNCENLFDCQHDSLKQDYEFMPAGARHWTASRYWKKLTDVGQTILSCQSDSNVLHFPDLVVLCEVENDTVMRDLTKRSVLRGARYQYIMTDSPDRRGIDVAILYSPSTFKLLHHTSINVPMPENIRPTRDVIYACGMLASDDTLHVFALHAPSRSGGERATRELRLRVARRIGESIDSIRQISPNAHIVVTGDFNAYHNNPSMKLYGQKNLVNISEKAKGMNMAEGTYKYQGIWKSLDHIFTTPLLVEKLTQVYINDSYFLLEEDEKYGGKQPFRTFYGYTYKGGVSDHLPLVATFKF